jgi:hypothetical protein
MPALFVYLIAVGLLLGGGYGALSWLAAPEPVKVVAAKANAKPNPTPHYEANPEAASSEASSSAGSVSAPSSSVRDDSDRAASGANEQPPSMRPQVNVAAGEQGAKAEVSGPAQDQQSRSAIAEVSPAEPSQHAEAASAEDATQEATHPAQAAPSVSPNKQQITSSTAAVSVAKLVKRPSLRQAHSEKRALALMTLRTIEFSDGRRITQLIPYHNGEPALEFPPHR